MLVEQFHKSLLSSDDWQLLNHEQIANKLQILLSSEWFEKIWFVFNHNDEFDDINLSKNINK